MSRVNDALRCWVLLTGLLVSVWGVMPPPVRGAGRRYIVQLDAPALCEAVPCTFGRAPAKRDGVAAVHRARLSSQQTALTQLLPPGVTVATLGTEHGTVEARFTTFVNALTGLFHHRPPLTLLSLVAGCC